MNPGSREILSIITSLINVSIDSSFQIKEYPLVIHPIPKIRVLSRWESNGQQRSQYAILTQAMSFWYSNENKNNAGIIVVMGWIILAIYTIYNYTLFLI